MNIRKADHVALIIANVERSRQFYTRVLGMQEVPRPENFNFPGAWLETGPFQIHLIQEDVEGRTRLTRRRWRPCRRRSGRLRRGAPRRYWIVPSRQLRNTRGKTWTRRCRRRATR